MIKSTLANVIVNADPSNYTHGRKGYSICKITPHHMAGILTAEQCGKIFQNPARNASANYGIGNDGTIACYVGEENRAWTSSSSSNDCQAITIEVSDCEYGGQWRISDAAWNSLINLCVDICKRYNFRLEYDGTPRGSLTRHNMFANTNCPGPYLEGRFQELADKVNSILDGETSQPVPQPTPSTGRNVGDVVTINGIYTASNSTKKLKPARTTGTITKIVNGALNPYLLDNGNLGWVNDSVIVEAQQSQPQPQPSRKSVSELADEVIAGKWGVGEERKNRLEAAGYSYTEVQNEVNKRYGKQPVSAPVSSEINVGDTVQINSGAERYVTGQRIPGWVKNNKYKVIQKANKKILLNSIMSWVYVSDVHKA